MIGYFHVNFPKYRRGKNIYIGDVPVQCSFLFKSPKIQFFSPQKNRKTKTDEDQ